jgi:hypothetical protein
MTCFESPLAKSILLPLDLFGVLDSPGLFLDEALAAKAESGRSGSCNIDRVFVALLAKRNLICVVASISLACFTYCLRSPAVKDIRQVFCGEVGIFPQHFKLAMSPRLIWRFNEVKRTVTTCPI